MWNRFWWTDVNRPVVSPSLTQGWVPMIQRPLWCELWWTGLHVWYLNFVFVSHCIERFWESVFYSRRSQRISDSFQVFSVKWVICVWVMGKETGFSLWIKISCNPKNSTAQRMTDSLKVFQSSLSCVCDYEHRGPFLGERVCLRMEKSNFLAEKFCF